MHGTATAQLPESGMRNDDKHEKTEITAFFRNGCRSCSDDQKLDFGSSCPERIRGTGVYGRRRTPLSSEAIQRRSISFLEGKQQYRHTKQTDDFICCKTVYNIVVRLRCKKKRAVKNRIENPILHSSGSFVYFSFRPSGRFFRFSF